jgi:hypothetical protein
MLSVAVLCVGLSPSDLEVRTSGTNVDPSLEFSVQRPHRTILDDEALPLGASIAAYSGRARHFCFNNGELGGEAGCAAIPMKGLTVQDTIRVSKTDFAIGANKLTAWIGDSDGTRLSETLEFAVHAGTKSDRLGTLLSILVPRDGATYGDEKSVPLEFDVRDFPLGGKLCIVVDNTEAPTACFANARTRAINNIHPGMHSLSATLLDSTGRQVASTMSPSSFKMLNGTDVTRNYHIWYADHLVSGALLPTWMGVPTQKALNDLVANTVFIFRVVVIYS